LRKKIKKKSKFCLEENYYKKLSKKSFSETPESFDVIQNSQVQTSNNFMEKEH